MTDPQLTSLSGEKLKAFPLWSGTRQECPLSAFLLNIVLEILATAIRKEKGTQVGKEEVKLPLLADDMIPDTESPKDANKKLLELTKEFDKFAEYKINIQKSGAFLYTNNTLSEREVKKTIPFTIALKKQQQQTNKQKTPRNKSN